MEKIKEIAFRAFKEGSDNFGETPTGEIRSFEYCKLEKQYHVSIVLYQGTAGIGLIPNKKGGYDICSGHIVFSVESTPELEEELKTAIITDF